MEKSLSELYFSYKRATKVVLDWLVSTVGHEKFRQSRPSTTEIVSAATAVRDQGLPVPEYVLSKFREALVKRREVHGLYIERCSSANDEANSKHKAFIERLEQAYQIILPLAKRPHPPSLSTGEQKEVPTPDTNANRYACLDVEDLVDDFKSLDLEPQQEDATEAVETPKQSEQVLRDDEIGEYIEISLFIYELDAICAKVNGYWADVASGKLSIVVAGFLTNTAFYAVERRANNSTALIDNGALATRWYFGKEDFRIRFADIPELQQSYRRFSTHFGLRHYWRILHDCRTQNDYKEIVPDAGSLQRPRECIHPLLDSRDSFMSDDLAMDKTQESMRQLLVSGRAISALEDKPMSAERLLPSLDKALREKDSTIPTYLVFGMEMLLSTYKAFLWSDTDVNPAQCRLASLGFANEVIRSIKDCMPCLNRLCWCQDPDHCMCPHKAFISEFDGKLKTYVQEKRFDLYYQAPWVAAGHMVEILQSTMYEGVYLCCENNYVAAVLHLYNALRQVSPQMQRVAWLDQLCEVFVKSHFPGGSVPKFNFSSVFRRSIGGRLIKTSDPRGQDRFQFSQGNSFGTKRMRPTCCHHLSLFYLQHMMDYQVTSNLVIQISEGRTIDKPSHDHLATASKRFYSTDFSTTLDKIKDAVLPEFQGDLPIARIDFITVFRMCVQLLEELCTSLEESLEPSAQQGFKLVDRLLEVISEHKRDETLDPLLPFLRPLRKAMIPFSSLDKEKLLCEFAWNI